MREILFRAKRVDTGEWVTGYYVNGDFTGGNNTRHYIFVYPNTYYEIYTETICTYTGMTDKNGHKIWENDIVKKHFYTDYDAYANSEEYTGVAKFTEYAWVIEVKNNNHVCTIPIIESIAYSKDIEHFEVIGNIFDNAELLENK